MARRRTKQTRRRTPKTFNAAKGLESILIANAVTTGFFNVGVGEFFLNKDGLGINQITAREVLSGITGGSFGTSKTLATARPGGGVKYDSIGGTFGETVKANLTNNGGQMLGQLILIPAGFKVFSKLTKQPRSMANRALKMSGLPVRV